MAVPCTVDNDLMMVDTSFGFDTACTEVCCYAAPRCAATHRFTVARLGIASVQPMWKQPAMRIVLAWYRGPRKKKNDLEIFVIMFMQCGD